MSKNNISKNTLVKTSGKLAALTAAASALPAVAPLVQAAAPTEAVMGLRYSQYRESSVPDSRVKTGDRARYNIDVTQLSFLTPLGNSWSLAVSLQDETLSGASPWFMTAEETTVDGEIVRDFSTPLVVMSGATPSDGADGPLTGIEEHRTDGSVAASYYYKGGSISGNIATSVEDDYKSKSMGLSFEREFDKKQTVVATGFSYSDDDIFYEDRFRVAKRNVSNPLPEGAEKTNFSTFISASRILSSTSIVLGGFSYAKKSGYLSDSYKAFDKRPDEKVSYTLNASYRKYLKSVKGAWHIDYRYYNDTWGVESNTFTFAFHKSWGKLKAVPSLRYYAQHGARFYDVFARYRRDGLDAETDGVQKNFDRWEYYSDDARLSSYGAIAIGLKFVFSQKPVDWVLKLEAYNADEELLPGQSELNSHPGMIKYTRVSFGMDHTF